MISFKEFLAESRLIVKRIKTKLDNKSVDMTLHLFTNTAHPSFKDVNHVTLDGEDFFLKSGTRTMTGSKDPAYVFESEKKRRFITDAKFTWIKWD